MKLRRVFVTVIAVGIGVGVSAQTTVSQAYRLAWEITAPSQADALGYDYRAIADGAASGTPLTDVQCEPAQPVGDFACTAAFPAYTPGSEHVVVVTAGNAAGVSLPSNEIRFTFLVVPSPPRNLRPVRP